MSTATAGFLTIERPRSDDDLRRLVLWGKQGDVYLLGYPAFGQPLLVVIDSQDKSEAPLFYNLGTVDHIECNGNIWDLRVGSFGLNTDHGETLLLRALIYPELRVLSEEFPSR